MAPMRAPPSAPRLVPGPAAPVDDDHLAGHEAGVVRTGKRGRAPSSKTPPLGATQVRGLTNSLGRDEPGLRATREG